jgi:type II secretory pathway component PulF
MARMKRCLNCGADNSVRRETCCACGAPLAAKASPSGAASAPGDRFAAVIRERSGLPQAQPVTAGRAPSALTESPLPPSYASGGQVRRAMQFFRQLHALVNSGMPLGQSLMGLAGRVHPSARAAVRALAEHVTGGGKLSDAMGGHPRLFLAYQVGLVRAGELGGALPEALDQIAADCEAEFRLRKAVGLALLPVRALAVVALAVAPVAQMLGGAEPRAWTPAQIWAGYRHGLLTVSLPIALGLGGGWGLWVASASRRSLAAVRHRLSLSLPLVGGAHRRAGMARFLGSLSLLLNAGVPIADAYRTAAEATGNLALSRDLLRDAGNLHLGRGLVEVLARQRVLSRETMDQLAIGEAAGRLPAMLGHIAGDYRRQVERSAKYLPYMLQLLAYAVVGSLVVLLWYTLANVYLNLRFYEPLKQLFDAP